MEIFERWLRDYLQTAKKEKICIKHIGRRDRIPSSLLKQIEICESKTAHFQAHTLVVALDYGGQDEMLRATEKLIMKNEKLIMNDVAENRQPALPAGRQKTENTIETYLDTHDLVYPNPDLVIRTSGEQRTSGFMIWQAAYSEWIFHDKHLPAFSVEDLDGCIAEFDARQRRYGG
jgi:undecaprenyl diphosphate synthase